MPIKPEKLKALRKHLGLSQQGASDTALVPKRTWQNWETSKTNPNHRTMPEGMLELFCIKNKINYRIVDKKVLIEL